MIKFKHFLLIGIFAVLIYACNSNDTVENFDHAAQAVIDNDSLVKFLQNNYYDTALDSVKPIDNGQAPLYTDSNLHTQEITENDIDYTLYYYVNNIGTPDPIKGFPTVMDSVFTKYGGQQIVDTSTLTTFQNNRAIWFTLADVIRGWTYGFTHFKGGKKVIVDGEQINYEDQGKGILFIPSGLAYTNAGSGTIPANANLMFYIELWDIIEDTDQDNDGLISILEDPDGDGKPWNDDTDGDFTPNYNDADDDGDGFLTKDEDANGDGDPRNDKNDPNNPDLPDYLNPNI